jgi:hypothetical protein
MPGRTPSGQMTRWRVPLTITSKACPACTPSGTCTMNVCAWWTIKQGFATEKEWVPSSPVGELAELTNHRQTELT